MHGVVVFATVDDGAASSRSAAGDLDSIGESLPVDLPVHVVR